MSVAKEILEGMRKRDGEMKEYMQAAEEIVNSLEVVLEKEEKYREVLKRLLEPERVVQFRVAWTDDAGKLQLNRGWRVQYNSAIGPYKGGLRFHPTVTVSVLSFLALEQVLKNSLTTLPMGGGKGGSDFDPKGKSDAEVMRFCQAFMTELVRYIGPNEDVPAGDIGVGGREIGYLFGQYKRLTGRFEGVLTGKGLAWGGSLIRPEATGYGLVYFAAAALQRIRSESLEGSKVLVSGSGNVATFAVEQLLAHKAVVLTMSDSSGYVLEKDGFTTEKLALMRKVKEEQRGRISDYAALSPSAVFVPGKRPWEVPADYAFPCATQNEIELNDAKALIAGKCKGVFEGANMPTSNEAIELIKGNELIFSPAKASNSGGVATSGLEMSQNSLRLHWTREEVDERLKSIMNNVLDQCLSSAEAYGRPNDLQFGANVAGFLKVAGAMLDQGIY